MNTRLAPAAIDSPSMRSAGRELLSLALMDARNHTLQLLGCVEQAPHETLQVLRMPPGEWPAPPRWVVGHVGWWAERWVARNPRRAEGPRSPADGLRLPSALPGADDCFDPGRLGPRDEWRVVLPDSPTLKAWLLETLEATQLLLDKAPETDDGLHLFRAALFHEDARGEQLVAMAQAMGLSLPLAPPAAAAPREPLWMPAMRWQPRSTGEGFRFELEQAGVDERVPEFEIDAQPVTWSQFVEFVDDGGYDRPELWDAQGWAWAEAQGRRAPRHVEQIGVASGAVLQSWFGRPVRMAGGQPALHVSWWEADAWARWAGRRLPTELEWEIAAHQGASRGFRWGEVHEWTAGWLRERPGDALADWSAHTPFDPRPFWGRARVRRGASFATRARLKHTGTRGFALPGCDHDFVGFRTCAL